MRPIDIARKLNISTSTLRHYEAWGVIPNVERAPNGYRIYTDEHIAYFECIRALLPGFGMDITKDVLKCLIRNQVMVSISILNKAIHELYIDRIATEEIISLLESQEFGSEKPLEHDKLRTIREVSSILIVPTTAIRHWERAGLISPLRNSENNYRLFNTVHIRQITFLRSLKKAVYSLETIKKIIKELKNNSFELAKQAAHDTLLHFDELNKYQLMGMHALYNLCVAVNIFPKNQYLKYTIY